MQKFRKREIKAISSFMAILIMAFTLNFMSFINVQASTSAVNVDKIFISEENYEDEMINKVEPYLDSLVEEGYFKGEENLDIFYKKYVLENSKGSVVISHGFSEFMEKQTEIVYYFLKAGYSVFALEHRGHGRSGLLGKDDSQVSVEDFDNYVLDLKTLIDSVVLPNTENNKVYLFAHSMGGGISAKFIEKYPDYIRAAALSAPMMEVYTGSYPAVIAKTVSRVMSFFGLGDNYVVGEVPYSDGYYFETSGTNSKNRFDYAYDICINNKELQRGGASFKWLREAFKATKEITSEENVSKIKTPIIIFQAENDTFVKQGGQNQFAEYAADCELIIVKNSKHEIYREKDEILKPYLEKIFDFFNENN